MTHLLAILGMFLLFEPTLSPHQFPAGEETPVGTRTSVATAGLKIVVDPATGRIIDSPTGIELARAEDGPTLGRHRSGWELRTFFLPDGGLGVDLDGWADHALVVEIGPDGSLRYGCSQGDDHLEPGHRGNPGEFGEDEQ